MIKIVRCLRVQHYIKNLIVFLPLFFNGSIYEVDLLIRCTLGFLIFCLISSVVYILNDIRDIEWDRKHELKRKRPIALGEVSIQCAYCMMFILLGVCLICCVLCDLPIKVFLFLILYLGINIFYTLIGKHKPIIDIVCLSSGFLIRLLYGGVLCDISVSSWLFLTVLCFSLSMSVGKRRGEYVSMYQCSTRPVLEEYTLEWLNGMMYVTIGMGLIFYSLWAIEKNSEMVYSIPLVMIIVMYYNLLIMKDTDGDPVNTVLRNKLLLFIIFLYALMITFFLYL